MERWWNEAQDELPPEERRYTQSWLQKKEEALELKAEKYGAITEPKPKSWWQRAVGGVEWLGKTIAGPLIPTVKQPESIKIPELKIPTEWPLSPLLPKIKIAFGPPKEYKEVYAPELGKMVPGKRVETPLGTKIVERLKFEWESDWPNWIGLGIFLGTYGGLKAIPVAYEGIISKNASKFAKTNLPVLKEKFPDVIKTAEDAKIYVEMALKYKLQPISEKLGGLRTGEAFQVINKLSSQIGNLKLAAPKVIPSLPAVAEKIITPATIDLTNKLVQTGLDKVGAEALAGSMHLMKEGTNELIVGQVINDFVDRNIARTEDLAPLTAEEKLGFNEMRRTLDERVTGVLEEEFPPPKVAPKAEIPEEEATAFIGEYEFKLDPKIYVEAANEANRSDELVRYYAEMTDQIEKWKQGQDIKGLNDDAELVRLSQEIYLAQGLTKEGKAPKGKPIAPNYQRVLELERKAGKIVENKIEKLDIKEVAPKAETITSELQAMLNEAKEAEAGRRIRTETGVYMAEPSTYPDWMSNYKISKKKALEAFETKKGITWERMQDIAKDRVERGYKHPVYGEVPPSMTEFYSGMPLPKSTQVWLKDMVKPSGEPTLAVEKAVNSWYAQTNEATLYGKRMGDAILKDMETRNIPRSQMKLIFKYRQMPDEYANQVSPEEKEIADKIGESFDKLHALAKENDVLEAYIENYITQLYKDKPEEVYKKLYPAGGMRLGTKFRFARQRKIPNTDEAEKLGLHPIYDLDTVIQIYTNSLYRTLANKQFVDFLKEMKNKDGLPLIMRTDKAPPNYVMVTEPAFNRYMWAGEKETVEGKETYLVKIPCKADPQVAKIINDMVNPFVRYKSWAGRTLTTAQGVVKRLIMYNPMIHGWNVFSDTLDEANFNFITAFKATFRGKVPDKLMKELDFKDVDELDLDAVQHGLASDVVWAARSELYEKMKTLENTEVSKILQPLIKLRDFNDKVLWGNIVLGSQRYVYLLNIAKLTKKNPDMDIDQIKSMAAHYTNDLLGTLPSIIFTKNEANLLRLFLFARNWTVSNLRLLTGALGQTGTSKIIPGFLRHKGLSAEEANKLAPHYQKHLIKGILALILMTTGINSVIKSTQEEKPTVWLPWEAEKGHEFDIDTGLRDKRGRKIYIKPPFFRYIGDYIGYGTDPMQTVKNKMEPLMKGTAEQVINYSLFFKRPITEREGIDAIKDRLQYFFRGTTPYGTAYGVTQPAARGWEKIVPLTGTWARHGITPEITIRYRSLSRDERADFLKKLNRQEKNEFLRLYSKQNYGAKLSEEELAKSSKYARKIIDFREETAGKWKDIDKEIDELILDGKTIQAIKLMQKSGRYKSVQGMKDRMRRVKGGLL